MNLYDGGPTIWPGTTRFARPRMADEPPSISAEDWTFDVCPWDHLDRKSPFLSHETAAHLRRLVVDQMLEGGE